MSKPYRLVIADDESLIAMDLKEMLVSRGYQIDAVCADGVEALEAVKKYKPDAVVMDVKMPKLSGLQAAKMIYHDNLAPVVLLTAYGEQKMIQEAKEAGIYGYVMKPVKENTLVLAIEMAIGRFEKERDMAEALKKANAAIRESRLINQAKGLLEDYFHISEAEALRRMQGLSMKRGVPLSALARQIIQEMKNRKK